MIKTTKIVQISVRFVVFSLIISLAFGFLNFVSPVVNAQNLGHPWPQFLQNPQLTSFNDGPAPRQPAILWTHTFPNSLSFSVAASYGKVFVPCYDGHIYALSESSGQEIWNYTLPVPAVSSPAVADERVFVSSGNGNVYALNASTGDYLWNFTLGSAFFAYMPPPTVADGMVFASSVDMKVYALNQTTGEKIWNFTTDTGILGGISVSGDNVFIADLANLYALNKGTGTKIWNYTIAGSFSLSSPVVAYNRIFVANGTNQLLAIDQFTGNKVWNFTTEGPLSASPASAYNKIFVNSPVNINSSKVYALDPDGNQVWQSQTSAGTGLGTPAIADGMVFVSSANSTYASVYTFNQSDGSIVWRYDNPLHDSFTSPIITDGKLIVAFNSTLTAFGIHDLALASLTVPSTAIPGEQVSIDVTVQNTGDFTETSTVTFYANGTSIGTGPVSNLAPNAATTISLNWDTSGFEPGNYNITAALATVPLERITSDDTMTEWIQVGIHNLTVVNLNMPSTVNSGDQVTINVTVQNTGNFTESSSLAVYVNLTTSLGTGAISNLGPGATTTLTFNWNTTGLQAGNCSIMAILQPVSMESMTSDNAQATTVTVNAPSAGLPFELIIGIIAAIIVIAVVVAIAVYLSKRKKKPEPPAPQTTETTQPPPPSQPTG